MRFCFAAGAVCDFVSLGFCLLVVWVGVVLLVCGTLCWLGLAISCGWGKLWFCCDLDETGCAGWCRLCSCGSVGLVGRFVAGIWFCGLEFAWILGVGWVVWVAGRFCWFMLLSVLIFSVMYFDSGGWLCL